jgi:hypothetical protein
MINKPWRHPEGSRSSGEREEPALSEAEGISPSSTLAWTKLHHYPHQRAKAEF